MDASIYRFDEVEIDTGQRVVRTPAGPVYLRARTFDLLIYLIENRQRIVSRLELRDALWPGVAVTENSVMQCVNEARKALGDDPRDPRYIRTAMKAGYQFIAEPTVLDQVSVPDEPPPSAQPLPETPVPVPSRRPARSWVATTFTFAAFVFAAVLIVGAIRKFDSGPTEPPWWEAVWWKFDEGSGNRTSDQAARLHGLLPEGVSWTPGISGSALLFQRPEVVVQGLDSADALPKGRAPRTLVAAVRVDGQPGGDTVALQTGYPNFDSGADHFYIGLHQTGVAIFGNHNVLIGRLPVAPGQWVHLAGVFEGGPEGLMRLYVNGQEDVSAKAEGGIIEPGPAAGPPRWSIGRSLQASTSFAGAIDDARVYARAIRPAEVRELHRCQMGFTDLRIGERSYYFSPVFSNDIEFAPASPGESSAQLRNTGKDFRNQAAD
jgi:DNA-binding winged helix-turn-helix (wHTH) protein